MLNVSKMTNEICIFIKWNVQWTVWCLKLVENVSIFFFLCCCASFYKLISELAISSFNDFTKQQDGNLILIKPQKFNKCICVY